VPPFLRESTPIVVRQFLCIAFDVIESTDDRMDLGVDQILIEMGPSFREWTYCCTLANVKVLLIIDLALHRAVPVWMRVHSPDAHFTAVPCVAD
jgi:hypothetical protein